MATSGSQYLRQTSVPVQSSYRKYYHVRQYSRHISLQSNPIEHWKCVFNKYDQNKDGYISVKELDELIKSRDYEQDIPKHVVKRIHELADVNNDGYLDFNEFVHMIHDRP